MSLTDNWFKHIETLCEEFERVLITEHEFDAAIAGLVTHPHSPVTGINFQIISEGPFGDISFGEIQPSEPTYVHTIDPFDSNRSSCRIRAWRKREGVVGQQTFNHALITEYFIRLIRSFWKPNLHDDKSRLLSLHNSETYQIIDNSLVRLAQATGTLYAFFCDIDNFKKVNDTHGEPIGDKVILEFAAIVYKLSTPHAIAIHRSGDEFVILYPAQAADDVLFLAKKIMQSVAEHDFGFSDVEVRVSAGITPLIRDYESITYKELEARAEKTLKPGKEIKLRGKARFEVQNVIDIPGNNEFSRNVALCLIKGCINSLRPFESPWLNMISRYSYELFIRKEVGPEDFDRSIDSVVRWIQPELRNDVIRAALPADKERGDYSPIFSSFDVILAAAHGVFRAELLSKDADVENDSLEINYDSFQEPNAILKLLPSEVTLVHSSDKEGTSERWNLGGFVHLPETVQADLIETRRSILIKIGHFNLKIPTSIFTEDAIVVDDRPTRGGGLRDFWEAAVAKLIARINTHTNVIAVYVLGKLEHAALTVEKLKDIESWKSNAEEISYKTGMSISSISTAVDRLRGKIHFPNDEENLVAHLANVLLDPHELEANNQSTNLHREHRFLRRELDMSAMALGRFDGCSVNTAAEAFPVVLEIARKFAGDEPKVIDQAGQELRDLADFKVHLKTPRKDLVPAFYEGERDSLEAYFVREFLSDTGHFGSVFQKTEQLEVVLTHLAEAIQNPGHQFSTRRAVLVIPNEIKPDEEFAPLGLISVRIIPRFIQHQIKLNYSFTWRTVEALVGFPYSLYGSIRFGMYFTEELCGRLQPEHARNLEMGDLSYIAHSLHIFVDEHGQNIARRIIDNASF